MSGAGAELYLRSLPVPFTAAAMLPVGGGLHRIADPTRRHWPDDPLFETVVDGVWAPVRAESVDRLAGSATLPDLPAGAPVRAHGRFLPLSLVGTAARWRLKVTLAQSLLDNPGGGGPGGVAELHGVELDTGALERAEGPLLVCLRAGVCGRYEALCALPAGFSRGGAIAAQELALAIDAGAITYIA